MSDLTIVSKEIIIGKRYIFKKNVMVFMKEGKKTE